MLAIDADEIINTNHPSPYIEESSVTPFIAIAIPVKNSQSAQLDTFLDLKPMTIIVAIATM